MSLFRNFHTRNAYTIEELYNILKNYQFSAGVPSLAKEGIYNIIVFPLIDNFNQVRIMPSGGRQAGERFTKWTLLKDNHEAGLGNAIKNEFLDDITGGITGFFGFVGSNASKGYQDVDKVLEEINSLGL